MHDIGRRRLGVLDHIMQQGRDDGRRVQPIVGENPRHLNGMAEIGIAGGPLLAAVHAHGVDIGAIQDRLVRCGIVGTDLLDQLVLPQVFLPLAVRAAINGDHRRGGRFCRRVHVDGLSRPGVKRVWAVWAQYRSS